jgi:hypothetical protein
LAQLLLDAFDQVRDGEIQGASETGDRGQAWITSGPLKQRDLGSMKIATEAELLLRKGQGLSGGSEVRGKMFAGLHPRIVGP